MSQQALAKGVRMVGSVREGSSWLSRERAAGYDPTILRNGCGLLGGAGAGANNAALTLGLSQLGELLIVDFDRYESHNATRAPFYPTASEVEEFGTGKAQVLAAKVARLSRVVPGAAGCRTSYRDGYLQELPAAVFRRVDFVLNGADNQAARAFLAEQAFLAGKPFIDAGFNGTLLRIGVFVPGNPTTDPCWRCRYPDYAINDSRWYSCERFARAVEEQGMVPAVQATAQIAGAIQAAHALELLHGQSSRANIVFALDLLRGDSSSFRAVRNPQCPSRWHAVGAREPRPLNWTPGLTWGELLNQVERLMSTDAQLEPLARLIETMKCSACERFMDVHASAWLYEAKPHCVECGGPFGLVDEEEAAMSAELTFHSVDFTRADLLRQTVSAFGVGPGDRLLARPFGQPGADPLLFQLDGPIAAHVKNFFTDAVPDPEQPATAPPVAALTY
jgi:molybdopterin/thiamine biosynthesis adenylyltransferase